jgi:hypothetical protein
MEKITNPGRRYRKQAFGEYLLLFSYKRFSIIKNGTNENRRISPGHHSVHASPDKTPPQTERAVSEYLFIFAPYISFKSSPVYYIDSRQDDSD